MYCILMVFIFKGLYSDTIILLVHIIIYYLLNNLYYLLKNPEMYLFLQKLTVFQH